MSDTAVDDGPLAKTTVRVTIDNERDVMAVNAWLARWGPKLRLSDNQGCGCCLDVWDVQGPRQALNDLPAALRSAVCDA